MIPDLSDPSARSGGDGAGYDIPNFDTDGSDRPIEVKTTNGWERTPLYITRNELAASYQANLLQRPISAGQPPT